MSLALPVNGQPPISPAVGICENNEAQQKSRTATLKCFFISVGFVLYYFRCSVLLITWFFIRSLSVLSLMRLEFLKFVSANPIAFRPSINSLIVVSRSYLGVYP